MISPNIEAYARQQTTSRPKLVKPEELQEAIKGMTVIANIASSEIKGLKSLVSELVSTLHDYAYPGPYTGKPEPEALQRTARDLILRAKEAIHAS